MIYPTDFISGVSAGFWRMPYLTADGMPVEPKGKAEVTFWDNFGTGQRTKRAKSVFRYTITSVIFQGVRKHNQVVK
jgi:hypothetical protein